MVYLRGLPDPTRVDNGVNAGWFQTVKRYFFW